MPCGEPQGIVGVPPWGSVTSLGRDAGRHRSAGRGVSVRTGNGYKAALLPVSVGRDMRPTSPVNPFSRPPSRHAASAPGPMFGAGLPKCKLIGGSDVGVATAGGRDPAQRRASHPAGRKPRHEAPRLGDRAAVIALVRLGPDQGPAGPVSPARDQHAQRTGRSGAAPAAAVAGLAQAGLRRRRGVQQDHALLSHRTHTLTPRQRSLSANQQVQGRPIVGSRRVWCVVLQSRLDFSGPSRPLVGCCLNSSKAGRNPPTG